MRQRLRARFSHLIPLLPLQVLLVGCQVADRQLGPSPDGPRFSQAGERTLNGKIVFHSNRDGSFDIFVMNADGTGITQLTDNYADDFGTIWSPNGQQIAFKSNRDRADDIYIMNADGSGARRLTTNAFVVGVTAWSPNGKQIAFISYRDYVFLGPDGDLEIFAINTDGTGEIRLTDNNVDDEGDHAGWSPNGKLFSFSSRRDGGDLDIFVMNADGTGVRQLTGIGGDFVDDDDSVWSPDGKHLAFQSSRDGDEEVYTMDLDGNNLIQLTHNTGIFDAVPGWTAGKLHPAEQ